MNTPPIAKAVAPITPSIETTLNKATITDDILMTPLITVGNVPNTKAKFTMAEFGAAFEDPIRNKFADAVAKKITDGAIKLKV